MEIGVLGGDRRQFFLAEALRRDGFSVQTAALGAPEDDSPADLLSRCDALILPLPATREGETLNAPFYPTPVPLDDGFAAACAGKRVLAGITAPLERTSSRWAEADLRDYYQREELLQGNAWLTAEAALGLAIAHDEGTLAGARCLVVGFGRIGRALCPLLRGVGAEVFCAARRPEARTAVRCLGGTPLAFDDLARPFDLIFNTVPAPVVTEAVLARQSPGTLLMELASAPGGFDRSAAARLGLPILDAPGLPGKISPKAAGELLEETVILMLKEERTR